MSGNSVVKIRSEKPRKNSERTAHTIATAAALKACLIGKPPGRQCHSSATPAFHTSRAVGSMDSIHFHQILVANIIVILRRGWLLQMDNDAPAPQNPQQKGKV